MGGKRKDLNPINTNVHKPAEGEGSTAVEVVDVGEYIEKLGQVSSATQMLMKFVGDQLHVLSGTIPVDHGFKVVKELREQSKECRDGMPDAFQPLRAQIEHEKASFYSKNSEAIEKIIRERVKEGIKKKFPVVLRATLGRYEEYLKTNSVLTDGVKQAIATTSARDANAIISPNYTGEEVALIPPHPDWNGLTLGDLKNTGGPAVAKLAKAQGLTPSEGSPDSEVVRIHNLNMVLRHLGVQYQAIPSWNGILLTSPTRKMSQ